MRKITFLWMFLLLIGTVHAQQPITSDAPVDGKWAENTTWYFIQFVNSDSYHTNGYLATKGGSYINNNGVLLLNGTTKPVNNAGLWCVVGNETDGYKFYNKGKGTGFVLGMTGGTAKMYETTTTETVSTNFDYAASTATFTGDLANGSYATYKIHGTENDYWNNSDGAPKCHLSIWSDSRALRDPGSAIQFTQVTADELTQICPIQPTTITDGAFAEDTQWYRLVINRDPKKYSRFDKINNVTANSTEKTTDRNSFFCFVADPDVDNGFKIYNMAAGTKKAFTSTGTNNEICTYSETGTTFVLEKNTSGADGYQFRVNGFDQAYFNDVYGQIGVWNDGRASTDVGGTFMIIEGTVTPEELASLTADFTELNTLVALAEQYTIGSGVGQYVDNSGGTFATALAAANALDHGRTDIAYQTTIDDAMETLQAAMTQLSINPVPAGKYYRMRVASQSAANDNYMSAYGNGDYLNTKVSENNVPTIFYLTTDGKLQAVYNDRYIKSAESAGVLEMTANADEAMVWTITGSTNVPGAYRLKAGVTNMYLYDWTTYSRNNTRIMAEENGARCQWTIEEVTLDEEAVKAFDLGLMSACQALNTIPLVDGVEPTYPTEYAYTPAELNAALTEIKGVTATSTLAQIKAALNSAAFATAQHYKGLCDSHGEALSVTCELKGQYSTVILPVNFTRPAAWTTYECAATTDGNQLVLTENTVPVDKNIPFIVEYTDEASMPTQDAPKTYQFIGYANGAGTENVNIGCLTGVMTAETTTIPEGSYVLALNKTTGKQAFYITDGTVVCPQYKCYFTAPASASPAKAFYFDNNGETTGIESIFGGNDGEVVIYNIAGQRINKLQKGVNIVNGRKVLVK